jgi:hypothetical protein
MASVVVWGAVFRTRVVVIGRKGSRSTTIVHTFGKSVLGEEVQSVSQSGLQRCDQTVAAATNLKIQIDRYSQNSDLVLRRFQATAH